MENVDISDDWLIRLDLGESPPAMLEVMDIGESVIKLRYTDREKEIELSRDEYIKLRGEVV